MDKIDVNGPNEHPLYHYLKRAQPGIFGLTRIKWNFEKFLVDKNGVCVDRYASTVNPSKIAPRIEELLSK